MMASTGSRLKARKVLLSARDTIQSWMSSSDRLELRYLQQVSAQHA